MRTVAEGVHTLLGITQTRRGIGGRVSYRDMSSNCSSLPISYYLQLLRNALFHNLEYLATKHVV